MRFGSVGGSGNPSVVGFVDDLSNELDDTLESLETVTDEFVIRATAKESDVDDLLEAADLALIVDARLDAFDQSSLDVARRYSRIHPGQPILMISNFFHDDVAPYDRIESMISPLTAVYKVNKRDLKRDEMRRWIGEQLESAVRDWSPEYRRGAVDVEIPADVTRVLSMTPKEWADLDLEQQDAASDIVYGQFAGFADSIFGSTHATWIVCGGSDFDILRWGSGDDHPPDRLLDEIQAQEDVVPFFFGRELEVDSIDLGGGIAWPGTARNPHYPGVRVRFDSTSGEEHEFLFDTGADANYLDRRLADAEGLSLGRPRSASRLGPPVRYRNVSTNITLLDGLASAYGGTTLRAIRNWSASIGQGKVQRGLLSALVLHDLKTAVRICGRTRTLRIDDRAEED